MRLALVKMIDCGDIVRWGFKSRTQGPLFMVWEENWWEGKIWFATVLFSSRDLRSIAWWQRRLGRLFHGA